MRFSHRQIRRILALTLPLALVATACGGKKDGDDPSESSGPVRGGSVTYALEAETGDGWCLPEGQLAISGIMVARTIYDTLTAPNADGEYVPYLAESVEPNDDYTEWTITLRDGVTFHDGSPLTAEVVKNNLDAYRGKVGPKADNVPYPGRSPLLFTFVLQDIDNVQATGDLEVTVTTTRPWVAFPAFLHSSGRMGIVAQAQLDDAENCDTNLIGTGPFQLDSWEKDRELIATKFADYWQDAPDGEPYPYLDEIRFTPIIESEQRVNALESGNIDLLHVSAAQDINTIEGLIDDGAAKARQSEDFAEITFVQMNVSKAPFDDVRFRQAMALAFDRDDYTEVINEGLFTMGSGPFATGSIGYLEHSGFPTEQDLDESRRLLAEYEAEKGEIPPVTLPSTPDAASQELAIFVQQELEALGLETRLTTVQQDTEIDTAIAGDFQINTWRNYPGGDPDELYVWFDSESPANFGRIRDPEIDRLFDEGRLQPDPDERADIYKDVNRQLTEGMWLIPLSWVTWRLAAQPTVHGYTPGSQPTTPEGNGWAPGLAVGHPLYGLWVSS